MSRYGKYKISELFEIESTISHDTQDLKSGDDYDYITRTSLNRAIHSTTGIIDNESINEENTYSLGLLQMNFNYRERKWYAGQFIRKIKPKFNFSKNTFLYFEVVLNSLSKYLLSVLVRDVDSKFLDTVIELPINKKGDIDYQLIDKEIDKIKNDNIEKLKEYFQSKALFNTTSIHDNDILNKKVETKLFKLKEVLEWQKQKEIDPLKIGKLSVCNDKKYPFYGQATLNNGIISYLSLEESVLNNKSSRPTILIHSNNQNIVYLETPFYLKDGHGATSVLQSDYLNEKVALYLITCIKNSITKLFTYQEKATKIALKNTEIELPVNKEGKIDYQYMEDYITTIEKNTLNSITANGFK